MATTNLSELDDATDVDLETKLRESKEELFNLRFQAATGQLESHGRLRLVKKDIARNLHRGARARARHPHRSGRREGRLMSENTTTDAARTARKVREGLVVSDKMDKTVVVSVEDRVKHALYGKVLRRSSKLKAHDEQNTCGVGDRVRIMETRPLSATKRWRVRRGPREGQVRRCTVELSELGSAATARTARRRRTITREVPQAHPRG